MKYANIDTNNKLLGWYSDDVHSEIPIPNIEVTDEQWQDALSVNANFYDGTSFVFKDFRTPEEIQASLNVSSITKVQAMRQLKVMGLWESFKGVLDKDVEANDEWTLALSLEFNDTFVQSLAPTLGITLEQLQEVFNEASKL